MLGSDDRYGGGDARGGLGATGRAWPAATSVLTGLAGFVAGAVVWHVIGFWTFVSSVVLRGVETPIAGIGAPAEPAQLPRGAFRAVGAPRERGDLTRCSSVGLDRNTGSVSLGDCAETAHGFALRASGRRDRAAQPARETSRGSWIVEVNADRDREP